MIIKQTTGLMLNALRLSGEMQSWKYSMLSTQLVKTAGGMMFANFRASTPIMSNELFDGRLATFGIKEHLSKERGKDKRCLADGRSNFLWAYINGNRSVSLLTLYFPMGNPCRILPVIADVFGVKMHSEREPEYWGFDTQEEWEAFDDKISKGDDNEVYCDLLCFLTGQSCGIRSGTDGMTRAKIAKKLVKEEPSLILVENKEKLLKQIEHVFFRDHVQWISLD